MLNNGRKYEKEKLGGEMDCYGMVYVELGPSLLNWRGDLGEWKSQTTNGILKDN